MATDTAYGLVRAFDDFNRKAIDTTNYYTSNTDSGGTAFAINEQRNGVVRGSVDTTDNDITNLFKDGPIYRPNAGGPVIMESRVTLITSVADGETYVGFSDDDGTDEVAITLSAADVQTSNATDAAGFAYTGAGTADWKRVGANNGSITNAARCNVKGATTPVAATWQTLKVVINEDGDADYYIDGIFQGTIASATRATISLNPAWALQGGGTARSVDVDYIYVQAGRI